MLDLRGLALPVLAAPMAGGPSTPALVAAVGDAGGLGFLAAGYRTPAQVADEILLARAMTSAPFGVNLFCPPPQPPPGAAEELAAYRTALLGEALPRGVDLPQPRWHDDDAYRDKLTLLTEVMPVAAVSFTFGCPAPEDVAALRERGTLVLVTVTSVGEVAAAAATGTDGVVVQGHEAGGHRGTHDPLVEPNQHDHLSLLAQCRATCADAGVAMVAAGGVTTPGDTRRALAAGAVAVAAGTAFLRCPEAGTSPAHRAALASGRPTRLTRAFSGRVARGIECGFMARHPDAPRVYPQVDQLTRPLRAAAAAGGDVDLVSAWAGIGHHAAQARPAAEVARGLAGR